MEKFSAFRDPGTGIQPFLTPIPPSETDVIAAALLPIRHIIGILRTSLILGLVFVYFLLVRGVCLVFAPIPPLARFVRWSCTALLTRSTLFLLGFWWIQADVVTRKRGKTPPVSWRPSAGDIIVSNWVSWVEILWLAYRYDPIFVLPVSDVEDIAVTGTGSQPISYTPGRKTGTGSAAISTPQRLLSSPRTILGFQTISLLSIIRLTGQTPQTLSNTQCHSIEDIRRSADRPIVVFPECTTSNGRGLLRFANVFNNIDVPPKGYNVFVMCIRYDPPSLLKPSLSYTIPSTTFGLLQHVYHMTTALPAQSISIRQLSLADSPSSQLFMVSEVVPNAGPGDDVLSEVCAVLIAQIGKMKKVGLGWEDKVAFLKFYRGRKK